MTWWPWVLVLALVLLVVEVVAGTIWLWRRLTALLGEVERLTGRLDELAGILEGLESPAAVDGEASGKDADSGDLAVLSTW